MAAVKGHNTQAETNRRYFHQAYRTGEHGWQVTEPSPQVLSFLNRAREMSPGGRLLDLGCGEGRHCLAAARLGFEVVGIDFEPLALERARRLIPADARDRIDLRVGDVLNLPLADASFDVVLDCGCFHHQRKADWPAYKAGVLRVLKARGLYILSAFSPRFHLFRDRARRWHLANGAYRRCFLREELIRVWEKEFEFLDLIEERGDQPGMWHALLRRR